MKILLAMTVTLALSSFASDVANAGFTVTSISQSGEINAMGHVRSISETVEGAYETEIREERQNATGETFFGSLDSSVQVTGDTISLSMLAHTYYSIWGATPAPREQWTKVLGSNHVRFSISTPHTHETVSSTSTNMTYENPEYYGGFGTIYLQAISVPLETLPEEFPFRSLWDGHSSNDRLDEINDFLKEYSSFDGDIITLPPGEYQLTTTVKSEPNFSASHGSLFYLNGGGYARGSFRLTAIVPEPSAALLLMIGTALLATHRSRASE